MGKLLNKWRISLKYIFDELDLNLLFYECYINISHISSWALKILLNIHINMVHTSNYLFLNIKYTDYVS